MPIRCTPDPWQAQDDDPAEKAGLSLPWLLSAPVGMTKSFGWELWPKTSTPNQPIACSACEIIMVYSNVQAVFSDAAAACHHCALAGLPGLFGPVGASRGGPED